MYSTAMVWVISLFNLRVFLSCVALCVMVSSPIVPPYHTSKEKLRQPRNASAKESAGNMRRCDAKRSFFFH